jgi:hypothetical protein
MIIALEILAGFIGWTLVALVGAWLLMSRNRIERRQKRDWERSHPGMSPSRMIGGRPPQANYGKRQDHAGA